MLSSTTESDIQFNLHFLDCQPDSILRSLNDQSILDHLYRAATNQILKFDKTYKRKESNRVTDLDQLSLLNIPVSLQPKLLTRNIPIEINRNENQLISIPVVKTEMKTEKQVSIPQAPPLPTSLNEAIKLQSQALKSAIVSPDRETLWAKVRNSRF